MEGLNLLIIHQRKFKRVHCFPRKTRFLPFPFFQKYTYSPKKSTIWEIIWHFSNLNFSSYWIFYLIYPSFSPFFFFSFFFPPLPIKKNILYILLERIVHNSAKLYENSLVPLSRVLNFLNKNRKLISPCLKTAQLEHK